LTSQNDLGNQQTRERRDEFILANLSVSRISAGTESSYRYTKPQIHIKRGVETMHKTKYKKLANQMVVKARRLFHLEGGLKPVDVKEIARAVLPGKDGECFRTNALRP
jgi:hypothetical protein